MYSQNNNRIITKYSEFLKEQGALDPGLEPPLVSTKHVNNAASNFYPYGDGDSDSGRESTPAHTASTVTVTSAEVHNTDSSEESGVDPPRVTLSAAAEQYTSSKFSDLFNSTQSHALFQRDLLIQSEEGSFLRDAYKIKNGTQADHNVANSEFGEEGDFIPEKLVHDLLVNDDGIKAAAELSPTKAKDRPEVTKDQSDAGSLPPYYAGSIASSSLAEAEMTLRRELLNNIRAISKATFFEDLYTNHGKSGDDRETSSDTTNNRNSVTHDQELEDLLRSEINSPHQSVVVAEKDGFLVFESAQSNHGSINGKRIPEVNDSSPAVLDPEKETSIHQWILNSQNDSETEPAAPPKHEDDDPAPGSVDAVHHEAHMLPEVNYMTPDLEFEPDESTMLPIEVATIDMLEDDVTEPHRKNSPSNSVSSHAAPEIDNNIYSLHPKFEERSDLVERDIQTTEIISEPPQVHAAAQVPILQDQFVVLQTDTEVISDSDPASSVSDKVPPLRTSLLSDPNARQGLRNRPSHLFPLNVTLPFPVKNLTFSILKPLNKQVRYPEVLPKRLSPVYPETEQESRSKRCFIGKVPGVLMRQNMDQWVAKIVRFYVNGDEHLPRFEYRFRPGRDVHNFDGLCDVLSEKLKLPRAVRFVFSLNGDLIEALDDLRHEHAYVVSSTRKFKALNYGGEVVETGKQDGGGGGGNKRRSRSRPPSAPSNRNPPIIRVRRERSLNGVVWGSPQQDWSSGSERNTRHLQQSALEAERVLRAAIEESQAQAQTPAASVHKQIIRVINGGDPTIQSQVLLNTRVSQEFQELVKDLGLAVKVPRAVQSRMETLTGRAIQSYSQLRSQLKAGNEAFYIYNLSLNPINSSTRSSGHSHNHRTNDHDLRNSPFGAVSKSVSSPTLPALEASLGRKFPNSIIHLTPAAERSNGNKLSLPLGSKAKAASSSSLNQNKAEIGNGHGKTAINQNTRLTNSISHPNLHQRRKSTKKRYEASKYLAHRSRSPSP